MNLEEWILKIEKPLKLEVKGGCQDKAVQGGLESYQNLWLTEVKGQDYYQQNRQGFEAFTGILKNYQSLSLQEREKKVKEFLGKLLLLREANLQSAAPPKKTNPAPTANLGQKVSEIPEIGPQKCLSFKHLRIHNLFQLLYYFPKWVIEKQDLLAGRASPGDRAFMLAEVMATEEMVKGKRRILKVLLKIDNEIISWVWFNRPYLNEKFRAGRKVLLWDQVEKTPWGKQVVGTNNSFEFLDEEELAILEQGRCLSLYHTTPLLSQAFLRKAMPELARQHHALLAEKEILDSAGLGQLGLLGLSEAVLRIHTAVSKAEWWGARKRLAFDELLALQVSLAVRKKHVEKIKKNRVYQTSGTRVQALLRTLPFSLTPSQQKVIKEIDSDLLSPKPMNRLLQGDVGSGKTIVAALSLLKTIDSGFQGALLAPTEILAEQHSETFSRLFSPLEVRVELLTGGVRAKAKREALARLASGESQLAIGTHALLEEGVVFSRLGMVVVDERHKFGVMQRAVLESKGVYPDALMMTATPFPRAMVLTLYGDTDLSVIDELPPGRKPIKTKWLRQSEKASLYQFIRDRIKAGEQAYIVYPLVEENSRPQLKAATQMAEQLSRFVFSDLRVGLIHGRLKPQEKAAVMNDFHARRIDILVATTVVEVGLDVSNASIIVIENAERFGLAQLHQLRGRVGRGAQDSYCFLLTGWPLTGEAIKRLRAMEATNDGFKIAETDLALRGPGELSGLRQHGILDSALVDLTRDVALLESARSVAQAIVEADPDLSKAANQVLKENLVSKYGKRFELASLS